MRIGVDVRSLTSTRSGVGTVLYELLQAMTALPFSHDVVGNSSGRMAPCLPPTVLQDARFSFEHTSVPNRLMSLAQVARLTSFPRSCDVDVCFYPNLGLGLSTRRPYVLTIHDMTWKFMPEWYSPAMRLWHRLVRPDEMIGEASALIVPSEQTKRDLLAFYPRVEGRIQVIPHGVSSLFSPTRLPTDSGVRSLYHLPREFALFVGTREPRKNVIGILEGMRLYRMTTRHDLHLVLVGQKGWNNRELHEMLARPDFRGWVHVLSSVSHEHLPVFYRLARVFLWPSFYEGFGLPVVEAMASGLPVVTSDTPALVALTGTSALHVNPHHPEDLARAVRELVSSPELCVRLREGGLREAKRYTWERAAREILRELESVGGSVSTL